MIIASEKSQSNRTTTPIRDPERNPTTTFPSDVSDEAIARASRIIVALRKKNPKQAIQLLSEDDEADVREFFSTGFSNIDKAFGGGLPGGRCSEFLGEESAGKSAFAAACGRSFTQAGGLVVIEDLENSVERKKLVKMGHPPDLVIVDRPDYIEQGWKRIWDIHGEIKRETRRATEKGRALPPPTLFIWDTVAAGETKREFDNPEKTGMMEVANITARNVRRMFKQIRAIRGHFIFINQVRVDPSARSFIPVLKSVGAKQVRYASTLRVMFNAYAIPSNKYPKTGYMVNLKTIKNKVHDPFQSASWVLDFKRGPSVELTALFLLKQARIIKVKGDNLSCPWKKNFEADRWFKLMRGETFRAKALEALATCAKAKYTALGESEDEDDEEDDDE